MGERDLPLGVADHGKVHRGRTGKEVSAGCPFIAVEFLSSVKLVGGTLIWSIRRVQVPVTNSMKIDDLKVVLKTKMQQVESA